MKIYIAVKSYWPSAGGIQTVTKYLAEGLAKKGYEIVVLTELADCNERTDMHNGVRIHRFVHKTIGKINYGEKQKYLDFITTNLHEDDVLVVVCAQSFVCEWLLPIMDKIKSKKVLYMHGMRGEKIDFSKIYSKRNFVKEFLLVNWWNIYFKRNWHSIMKFNACIHLFENDSSYYYFKKHGFVENYVIQNSCDDTFFSNATKTNIVEKYSIKRPFFIQVANYDENKNQLLSIKAFESAGLPNADLVFIGSKENSYFRKIKSYVENGNEYLTEHIHLLVSVPREDTVQLIKNSYMCLLSSHSEYFPISLIEGMASKKAFISTAVGEVPKLIGGISVNRESEMSYWMKYCVNHPEYVTLLEDTAYQFAKDNMFVADKIDQFEKILLTN